MSPQTATYVEERVSHNLLRDTNQNHALTPHQQLLTSLRFLATNGFYHLIRDAHGLSESSVYRSVKAVVSSINDEFFDDVVRWPNNCAYYAGEFYNMYGMPSVCGLIDGTLIKIKRPSENEANFVDRFGDHSLNVMLVGGPHHEFVHAHEAANQFHQFSWVPLH